jgi:hypothetical protein
MPTRGHEGEQRGSHSPPSRRAHTPAGAERHASKRLPNELDLLPSLHNSLETLAEELSQGKSEHLLEYLNFAARFHNYSRANQMLILLQKPDATMVASYQRWKELGYQVARGQAGIRILAPSFQKVKRNEAARACRG